MIIVVKNKHTLLYDEFKFKCTIGKGGFSNNKKEGDKKPQEDYIGLEIYIIEVTE